MPWDQNNQGGFQGGDNDIGDMIRQAKSGLEAMRRGSRNVWPLIFIVFLIAVGALTSAYTISAGHRGVVLRFGKFSNIVMPGLHFKVPFGVDRVFEVYTDKVDTETFGFKNVKPGVRSRLEKDITSQRESLMLTRDLNVIDMEWIIQYRRQDPKKYLFSIQDPIQAIRDVSESVIRRIVGNRSFDYILQNREEINRLFQKQLQEILDEYESGIRIVNVRLQNVVPPDEVKDAFNEVNEAQQEKERLINEAQETYNREIPKARGEAERVINGARGYALERVNKAKGETARFTDVLREYRNSKEVTKQRLYLEAYREIIPNAKQVYVVDSKQKSILPLLNLEDLNQKGGDKK